MKSGFCLLWLFGAFCCFARADTPHRFDIWTADDGLPQNVITGIAQTPDGYLWIATFNGLARFDGVRFTVFDKSSSPAMNSNRLAALHPDGAGDLWFHTGNGDVIRYHNRRFVLCTSRQGPLGPLRGIVTRDGAGHILFLSPSTLAQWESAKGEFVPFHLSRSPTSYKAMLWEGGGLWAADAHGFECYVGGHTFFYPLPSWLPASSLRGAARDQEGTIWLETVAGRHAKIVAGRIQLLPEKGSNVPATVCYRDRSGNIFRFEIGSHLTRMVSGVTSSNQVVNASFTSLFEDQEGEIWFGTDGQGLFRLQKRLIRTYTKQQGLIDNNVYPIYQDHEGAIWIGAWSSGLSRYREGTFTSYTARDGLPTGLVTAIAEDRNHQIWVSAHGGLRMLSHRRFVEPHGFIYPKHATLQAICQDRTGVLWVGTTLGLVRYQNESSRLITTHDGLAGDDVRVLVETASGDLWIGGYGGLTRLRNGQFTHWTTREGLPSNTVRSVYVDREGVVWIGTYDGGLGRLEGGKITRCNVQNGLFDNGVFQILEDGYGNFWMSCNRGVYRVGKRQLSEVASGKSSSIVSVRYGRLDGMLNVECNGGLWPAGIRARDGTLWFPTQEGVAVIDPSSIPTNPQPPPIVIESAQLEGVSQSLDQPLRIRPNQDNLEIHYTALSFIRSRQIHFRYKLEGLESNWVEAGPRRTAYYSHLPPGSYIFRVIARNSDGIWNNEGQSLSLSVLAPFYQTWWFQLIVLFCVAGLVWFGWRYRVGQLERTQAVQQAFSSQLIASQETERKRIAAELHDSLGQRLVLIKNLALFLWQAQDKDQNGKLARWAEEISAETALAIEETRQISYDLRPYQLERLGLTKALESLIRKTSSASGVPCVMDLNNIDDALPEHLRINFYRVVQECLNNIVKHAQASEAEICIIRRGLHQITLTVRDDGRGLPSDIRAEDKAGFGLTGMAERARLLGGELTIQSEPGWGTLITLEINHVET